jgi:F-type H+-transporting ATPase subunit b
LTDLGFNFPSLIVFVVNFLILLGIMYLLAYKPILRVMDRRADQIRESLEAADRASADAAKSQDALQSQINEARLEAQKLIDQARSNAERYHEAEQVRARQESEALVTRAREDIRKERDAAIQEATKHFADLAISAAERIIHRSLDRDAHKDLIEQVIQEGVDLRRG